MHGAAEPEFFFQPACFLFTMAGMNPELMFHTEDEVMFL